MKQKQKSPVIHYPQKNEKISKSLKNYHKRKKSVHDAKAVAGFIVCIIFFSIFGKIIMPTHLAEAEAMMNNHLPINEDKKELTVAEQIRIIAREKCNKKNLGDYCIEDLQAIAWVESRFNCSVIGDFGSAHGCYQIHQGYHPDVSQAEAEDLNFAIEWTLDRLTHYSYPVYRSYAIMKHNGTPNTPKTLKYLENINDYINL